MQIQSWNNILQYIKMNLGVPINAIEFSDEEIIEYLKNNTLVEFSQYVPKKKYYVLDTTDIVDDTIQKYRINTDDYIIDIMNIYYLKDGVNISGEKILDDVLFAKMKSILDYLSPKVTWEFVQPNYIIFFTSNTTNGILPAVVEYGTVYDNLNEIPADMYQWFKKLALADIKILLGNTRTKYQLSTPFGQIVNNGDTLKQEGMQERQIILDNLMNNIPPDKFIVFL